MKFLILPLGLIFAFFGLFMLLKRKKLKSACSEATDGKVLRIEAQEETQTETDEDGHTTERTYIKYFPVYEYVVGDKIYVKTSTVGNSHPKLIEGQAVKIMYDPSDAEKYVVSGDKDADRFGLYFMLFGILVAIFGVVALFVDMGEF